MKINVKGYLIIGTLFLVGCGSIHRGIGFVKKTDTVEKKVELTAGQQRKYDYYFLEAVRMKEKGDWTAAMDLYNHCLQINPSASSALYEISQFYLMLEQKDISRKYLEKAVSLDPDNFWYKQTLAAFYEDNEDYQKAISLYEEMVKRYPDRSDVLMLLTDLYNKNDDHANVISSLNRLETLEGRSEQISMEKFRQYLTMGQKGKAYKEVENLSLEYPNDLRYKVMLGDAYLNDGRNRDAYDIYNQVLEKEPENAFAQLSIATYYNKIGQDSLYKAEREKVLLNEQLNTEARLNLMRRIIVENEQEKKDSTEILNLFDKILKQSQDNADMGMLCAQYMITKNMPENKVKPVLNRILSIDPDNSVARLQLLSYAVKKEDYNTVIEICKPALEYNPESMEFYYYLGVAYYQTDKKDDALDVLKKGTGQFNEKSDKKIISDFYSIMGDIYHTKDMNNEAYAAYDSSLVYNPDNIGSLNNYAYYLSIDRKNLDKAEEMSYKTIKAEPQNSTYLDTYAWILFEKKRYSEALIYIEQAMKNGGDKSSVIIEHCGDISYMNGDKDTALKYWKQADSMENESKTLKKKIAKKEYITD